MYEREEGGEKRLRLPNGLLSDHSGHINRTAGPPPAPQPICLGVRRYIAQNDVLKARVFGDSATYKFKTKSLLISEI